MMTTLEKVRWLEEYIALSNSVVEPVIENTINNSRYAPVIPAKAGICKKTWIPAFAGMTAGEDIRLILHPAA